MPEIRRIYPDGDRLWMNVTFEELIRFLDEETGEIRAELRFINGEWCSEVFIKRESDAN